MKRKLFRESTIIINHDKFKVAHYNYNRRYVKVGEVAVMTQLKGRVSRENGPRNRDAVTDPRSTPQIRTPL